LTAFDEIDPVSTVSALNAQPQEPPAQHPRPRSQTPGYASAPPGPYASAPMQAGAAPPRGHKSTLLGLPSAMGPVIVPKSSRPPGPASRPSVPPLVPRPQSIPPAHAPNAAFGGAAAQPPRLEMDWDDEELSTQIYDRPEDQTPAHAHPTHGTGPHQQVSGSFPPALGAGPNAAPGYGYAGNAGAPPGAPSPFAMPGQRQYAPTAEVEWPVRSGPQRRPMLAAILAVVGIIGLIVLALLVFRRPSLGSVHLSTNPGDVSVAIDGKPIVGSSPFVINDVMIAVPHEIIVSKQGYRSWQSRFELQSEDAMELPAIVLDPLESGFALDSVPSGAAVYVDGKRFEQATPVRVSDLTPGDHQIKLEAVGYAPWESSLHVTPGTVLDLPTAQLIAHAQEPEAPPPSRPEPSVSSSSTLSSTVASAHTHHQPAPRPRDPDEQPPSPPPAAAPVAAPHPEPEPEPEPAPSASAGGGTGTLRVQTRPWSKVSIDGRPVGTTPLMNVQLSAGKHTLTFTNDDFGIHKTVKVQIEAGQILTQVLTLTE
jgi:serine/threonine-protein kinase